MTQKGYFWVLVYHEYAKIADARIHISVERALGTRFTNPKVANKRKIPPATPSLGTAAKDLTKTVTAILW